MALLLASAAAALAYVNEAEHAHARTGSIELADHPARVADRAIVIIDGDTVRIDGDTFRIANIDTPETGSRARCDDERERAAAATAHARSLIHSASAVTAAPSQRTDVYGRTIARLVIDGVDFGEAMIAAGHARPWRGRRESWCDGV